MALDLILCGGTIVSPEGSYQADIGVKDSRITAIASDLTHEEAQKVISLEGKHILPGCIDSHMHLWESGWVADPDFKAGTLAAIAGGITTIIDHPLTPPEVLNSEIFGQKVAIGERTSYTDFALHGGVGHGNLGELEGMYQAGCTAFKVFMSDSGCEIAALSSGELQAAFQLIGSLGGTVLIHAENEEMLQYNRRQLEAANRKDPMAFVEWRPVEVEIEAIHRALYLLQGTGARAVFLHTTVPEGVEMVKKARYEGLDAWVETCPHNLYLTTDHLREHGPWVTFAPPVRDPGRTEALWGQLNAGLIVTVGSDHCPIESGLKTAGIANIWDGLFGVPDVETMVPLMLNAANKGWISIERIANVLAENPAKLYGIYPRKGVIRVGSDADFTVVDMAHSYTIRAKDMYTSCGWTPYEGWQISGSVTETILRGKIVMQSGDIFGQPGDGRFLSRSARNEWQGNSMRIE